MPKRTKSGKLTKLGDFENKVDASKLPGGEREKFAIANKIGLKRGSKTTARGKRPAAKHKKRGGDGDAAMMKRMKMQP